MKTLWMTCLGVLLLGMGGCAVYTPYGRAVVVDPDHHHESRDRDDRREGGGRDFCPPGQAKKGRC